MNDLWFLIPVTLLVIFLVPTIIELLRRRDKGPREVPDMTIYGEKVELDSIRMLAISEDYDQPKVSNDVILPNGIEVQRDMIVNGRLTIGNNCHVRGTLKASGSISVGEATIIDGSILSRGEIIVRRNCRIAGVIVSIQDIILGDNVTAEAVSTEKTVKLGLGVKINKRISGTAIVSQDHLV